MKVFTLSDIHLDHAENLTWLTRLSAFDYLDDVLILAGDITDSLPLLEKCFKSLSTKFKQVLYVPGNHDLWVLRDNFVSSIDKYHRVCKLADDNGIGMQVYHNGTLTIVPLLSWYDFSFAEPGQKLNRSWMDFHACVWPEHQHPSETNDYFLSKNSNLLNTKNQTLISFSHFLPRIDLLPSYIPPSMDFLHPVLGSSLLEEQIRELKPQIHVYGHSHVNRQVDIDDIRYINNAFGYPSETRISNKRLLCIHEQ